MQSAFSKKKMFIITGLLLYIFVAPENLWKQL